MNTIFKKSISLYVISILFVICSFLMFWATAETDIFSEDWWLIGVLGITFLLMAIIIFIFSFPKNKKTIISFWENISKKYDEKFRLIQNLLYRVIFVLFIIGLVWLLIYGVGVGVNYFWENGKKNKLMEIYCENIGCNYNFNGNIWELSGKYYDTKEACREECVLDLKDSGDDYSEDWKEYVIKTTKDMPEYKRTWYYKIENWFRR